MRAEVCMKRQSGAARWQTSRELDSREINILQLAAPQLMRPKLPVSLFIWQMFPRFRPTRPIHAYIYRKTYFVCSIGLMCCCIQTNQWTVFTDSNTRAMKRTVYC